MIGADISNHQRGLTMDELKAEGVEFVIIKATQGTHFIDPCGAEFYAEACAAGLPAGVYCYSEATTPEDAEAEARFLLAAIRGHPMPCGVWLDIETPQQLRLSTDQLTCTVAAWCRVIRAAGYTPGIYSSELSAWPKIERKALRDDVLVWVAHYGRQPAFACDLWQRSDSGSFPGCAGPVDTDEVLSERMEALVRDGQRPKAQRTPGACKIAADVVLLQTAMQLDGYWPGAVDGLNTAAWREAFRGFAGDVLGTEIKQGF